ncbi:MAG: phosphotransferase, partial [Acidobacteria bacterium]|nr:phosphotransferase [Acidobacteriota bacterium]
MEQSLTLAQGHIAREQRGFALGTPLLPDVKLWERIVRRPHFDIYRVPSADGQFAVAKCARGNDEVFRRCLRHEFSALDEVHRRAGEVLAGTIPDPILFREKEGIMLVSGVRGVSLEEKLHWHANVAVGWKNLTIMGEIGRALGDWIRTFHGSTAWQSEAHHHHHYVSALERNVCRSRQVGLSPTVLEHVRHRAAAISQSLHGVQVHVAAAHGDFIPQNILFDGVQPRIIDFGAYCGQAPVYRDVSA